MQTNRDVSINDYTEIVQRLPVTLRLAYGVGHVLNDICASMWFTYLLVYFHFVLGFSATHAGVLLLIGQIADALATPFVGLHSDKNDDFWLCKYGRRKTWHLLGTICVYFTFPFIFSPCINCENAHQWAQLIYYAAFIVIFQFGWAAVQISHLSLVAELTPTDHERTELIAIRYSFTVCSNILVYCTTWGLLHVMNNDAPEGQIGPSDAHKFQIIVLSVTGIGIFTSLIFHIFVKEGNINNSDGSLRRNTRPISVLLKSRQLYQAACIYMPTRLFVNLSQIYIPLYLHEFLNMPATLLAIIPLTMFLSSFITSLVIEKLNTKLGRKNSYCIGVLFGLSACLWIRFGKGYTFEHYQIYSLSMLLGSAGSIMLVTSLGIITDFIGQNTENGAFVYGFMSFTDKLGNGLAVMLIQYLHKFTESTDYYRNIISNACSFSATCGLLMVWCISPFPSINVYNNVDMYGATENIVPSSSVIVTTTNDRTDRYSSREQHVT